MHIGPVSGRPVGFYKYTKAGGIERSGLAFAFWHATITDYGHSTIFHPPATHHHCHLRRGVSLWSRGAGRQQLVGWSDRRGDCHLRVADDLCRDFFRRLVAFVAADLSDQRDRGIADQCQTAGRNNFDYQFHFTNISNRLGASHRSAMVASATIRPEWRTERRSK